MNKMNKDTQDVIIEELKSLNEKIEEQKSLKRIFLKGVIYGVGFFVGSAILATILLGFLRPWVSQIDWARENFERGSSLQ